MIDLDFAIKAFEDYRKNYPDTERINLKVAHMKRVMARNINLAKNLKLNEEDVSLAGVIGILHDIGRFEQVKRYDTFVDKDSVNHAKYSSELLFEKGYIRNFIKTDEYDTIIKSAIENHNKFEIEKDIEGKALLHSKLIRDADKIDIYIEIMESTPSLVFDGPYDIEDKMNEKVLRDFCNHKCIKTEDMKCKVDDYVRKVALIYGLYYPQSLKIVKEQDLINRLSKFFKESFEFSNESTISNIDLVKNIANSYIEKQVETENAIGVR